MSKVSKDLKRLVSESSKFRSSGSAHIERSSAQVAQQSHRLAAKVLRSGALTSNARGHVLLASKGINTDELGRGLAEIHVKAAALEPMEQIRSTDVEGFLRNQHEMILLTAIEDAKKETLRSYQENYQSYLSSEWNQTKHELLEGLGQSDGSLPSTSLDESLLMTGAHFSTPTHSRLRPTSLFAEQSTPLTRGGRAGAADGSSIVLDDATMGGPRGQRGVSQMNTQMMLFSQVVSAMNYAAQNHRQFAMLSSGLEDKREPPGFLSVVQKMNPSEDQRDSWRMMRSLFDEGKIGQVFEHNEAELSWKLVQGSRRFLQEQYALHIKRVLNKYRHEVRLGGNMSTKNQITKYLEVRKKLHHEAGPWQMIYYALRCGDAELALECAATLESPLYDALRRFFEQEGHVNASELMASYRSQDLNGNHFRLAVYNIIGNCDIENALIKKIFETNEDYLWYSLSLLRKDTHRAQLKQSDYTLERLHQNLSRRTAAHFNPRGDKPFVYFQVLMHAQLFKDAIQYLYNTVFTVDAVHFAIILAEYNLISQELIKSILRQYLRPIGLTDPKTVITYLQLLKEAPQRNRAIKEFILESREYDALLGVIQPNGQHKGGCLSQLMPSDEVMEIVSLAARDAESDGKFMDALRLFDLCGDFDRVINILNQQLAEHLTRPDVSVSKVAAAIRQKYERHQILQRASPTAVRTFQLLMDLERFFGFYRQKELETALQTLYRLNIIPEHRDQIRSIADGFRHLEEPIKRNFAEILLAAMNILKDLFAQKTAAAARLNIKESAQALMTFVGTLQFSVPSDVYSTLVRINCLMS